MKDRLSPKRQAALKSAAILAVAAALLSACTPGTPAGDPPSAASPAASGAAGVETSQWRPALHYTPQRNWMNDPNGLVYYEGKYHLFYQYNPEGIDWGNMSWGHATSTDLIHWDEQPVAMPETDAEEIFSGSIVVDKDNTSGLGTPGKPALVALYTSVDKKDGARPAGTQAQSVAVSKDGGDTWQRVGAAPVLSLNPASKQFRDPKVFWYGPGGYWVMAAVVADAQVVKLYKSTNLLDWNFLSDFGNAGARDGLWEMPDLFPLPVDGDAARSKWVMLVNINPGGIAGGSGAQYFVGEFDGVTFRPEGNAPAGSEPDKYDWIDRGPDFYAVGTVANAPGPKPVAVAWMSNWNYAQAAPTSPWRGAMALPRELSLKTLDGKVKLTSQPVAQVNALVDAQAAKGESWAADRIDVDPGTHALPEETRGTVQAIDLTIEPGKATKAGLTVRGSADGKRKTVISYNPATQRLELDRSASNAITFSDKFSPTSGAPLRMVDGRVKLRVVIDNGSVEIIDSSGAAVLTALVFPGADDDRTALFSEGNAAAFQEVKVSSLS